LCSAVMWHMAVTVMLFMGLVVASRAQTTALRKPALMYDPATEVTVKGSVEAVKQLTGPQSWAGTHLSFKTDAETLGARSENSIKGNGFVFVKLGRVVLQRNSQSHTRTIVSPARFGKPWHRPASAARPIGLVPSSQLRTVSTGQAACTTTLCAVFRSRCVAAPMNGPGSRTPRTIKSASRSFATLRISSAGSPN
jgi:hypothetical protein